VAGATAETTVRLLREGVERLHAAGSETARLDAELLLGDAIGVGRTVILAHPEAPVGADAAARYLAGIERRAAGEPVAYIRGMKEFYGMAFSVDSRALIPRPETERLVELAEAEVRRRLGVRAPSDAPIRIVDVGTGSGAIAVAVAVTLRRRGALGAVSITAVDASPEALDLARENAVGHTVGDSIAFGHSDLLASVDARFDLVLANLPYVRTDALPDLPIAASFEPVSALDGGPDGLAVIERLLAHLPNALANGGVALVEIGADQGELIVERCAQVLQGWRCAVESDLAGLPRVAVIARN
jgi:release factor glutamine methyltransferase